MSSEDEEFTEGTASPEEVAEIEEKLGDIELDEDDEFLEFGTFEEVENGDVPDFSPDNGDETPPGANVESDVESADPDENDDTDNGDEQNLEIPEKTPWVEERGIPTRDYFINPDNRGTFEQLIYGDVYYFDGSAEPLCWFGRGDSPKPKSGEDVHGPVDAGIARYETDTEDGVEYITTIDTLINADLRVEAVLEYPNDPDHETEILLEIAPTTEHADTTTVQAPFSALETAREFRENILSEVPGVVLNGGQNAVNAIKRIISADLAGTPTKYAHEEITTVEVDDEKRLITPEGTLSTDGWVPEDDRQHIWSESAKRSGVIEMWDLGADTLGTDDLDFDVAATAAENLTALRDPNRDRWLTLIGYAVASTHRPTLTNPSHSPVEHWSNASVAGQADSGKSASLEKLAACLGAGSRGDLLTLSDTTPQAMLDALTASDVVTVGIDEYDSAQIDARKISKLHNYAKSASTGEMVKKSDSNYGDHTWHVESPLIISGEERLDHSLTSLTTRSIEIPFSRRPTQEGSPGRRAFHDLGAATDDTGRPAELHHALALWQHELAADSDTDALIAEWRDAAEWARDELANRGLAWGDEINSERIMQHAETVAFGLRRYREFAESIGAQIDLSDEQIGDTLEYAMEQKVGENAANVNNMDRFFELFAAANRASIDYVDEYEEWRQWYSDAAYVSPGDEFDFVHADTSEKTRLRIHPKDTVAAVSRYIRDHGLDEEVPDASTLKNWVDQSADEPESYAEGIGLRTNGRRHIGVFLEDLTEQADVALADVYPAERLTGDDAGEEQQDTDDDGGDTGSNDGMPQGQRRGIIRRLIEAQAGDDGAPVDEIAQQAAAAAACDKGRIEQDLKKMRKNGEIFEAAEDHVRVT